MIVISNLIPMQNPTTNSCRHTLFLCTKCTTKSNNQV
uniref:Uncharacterized protein n=1 Tax=Rhizophora mucronata TaxID=61149 RepID=A0A2P2R139_RHIMU